NSTSNYICIGENKTWDESRSYCQANHTDLASVRDETEKKALLEALNYEPCQKEFWIGLSRVKWQWSDQSVFHIQNWEDKEPNGGDTEKCVEMCGETGQWDDESCDETQTFICYDDDLVLVRENKTWVEALNHCRQQRWDLVSIHSERIQHWVQRRARNASTPYVWLGLRYTCILQVWFWVSEQALCIIQDL
ncbi:macrophage mannose receptor 1-like, partial [Osmerus eperlanus]|uniref:macrophage mannose receptor 1-like n=1 Tax=Osmerus eperlanus TaxID=29151 RepID=UPI002E15DF8A